jgi:hypothetical protein
MAPITAPGTRTRDQSFGVLAFYVDSERALADLALAREDDAASK